MGRTSSPGGRSSKMGSSSKITGQHFESRESKCWGRWKTQSHRKWLWHTSIGTSLLDPIDCSGMGAFLGQTGAGTLLPIAVFVDSPRTSNGLLLPRRKPTERIGEKKRGPRSTGLDRAKHAVANDRTTC